MNMPKAEWNKYIGSLLRIVAAAAAITLASVTSTWLVPSSENGGAEPESNVKVKMEPASQTALHHFTNSSENAHLSTTNSLERSPSPALDWFKDSSRYIWDGWQTK